MARCGVVYSGVTRSANRNTFASRTNIDVVVLLPVVKLRQEGVDESVHVPSLSVSVLGIQDHHFRHVSDELIANGSKLVFVGGALVPAQNFVDDSAFANGANPVCVRVK